MHNPCVHERLRGFQQFSSNTKTLLLQKCYWNKQISETLASICPDGLRH